MLAQSAVGQSPSAVSLLRELYIASGGARWDSLRALHLRGTYSVGGIDGTFEQTVDLRSGANVFSYDIGPLKGSQGNQMLRTWAVDQSGLVTVADAPEARADAITQSYENRNGWFHPDVNTTTRYVGRREDKAETFDLVEVTPPGGRTITLWTDALDHLLKRMSQKDANQNETTTFFSDYREIGGIRFPYKVRTSTGDPAQDSVEEVSEVDFPRAANRSMFSPPHSVVRDATLLGDSESAVIPFTISNDRIVIQVSVDGGPALPFVLDSGAIAVLTPEAAKTLAIAGVGQVSVTGVGSAQESARIAQVKKLTMGAVEMRDQQILITNLPSFLVNRGEQVPIAGLIGDELLRRFPMRIDYQKQTLLVYRPGSAPAKPRDAEVMRLYFNEKTPLIQAAVDGTKAYFAIDTGDNGNLTLFSTFYQAHQFPVRLPGIRKQQGGVGGETDSLLTRVDRFSLGSYTLHRPLTELNFSQSGAFASLHNGGNLGCGILKNFVLTFDYEHRRLYVQRSRDFNRPNRYNRSGMVLKAGPDGMVEVKSVATGSPAAAAGLQHGDRIVALGGKKCAGLPLYEVERVLSGPADTVVAVSYMRGDEARETQLSLAELVPVSGSLRPFPKTE